MFGWFTGKKPAELLQSNDVRDRLEGIRVLVKRRPPVADRLLLSVLKDRDASVRKAAAQGLQALGWRPHFTEEERIILLSFADLQFHFDPDAKPKLAREVITLARTYIDSAVRCWAVLKMSERATVSVYWRWLEEDSRDENPEVRQAAAETVAAIRDRLPELLTPENREDWFGFVGLLTGRGWQPPAEIGFVLALERRDYAGALTASAQLRDPVAAAQLMGRWLACRGSFDLYLEATKVWLGQDVECPPLTAILRALVRGVGDPWTGPAAKTKAAEYVLTWGDDEDVLNWCLTGAANARLGSAEAFNLAYALRGSRDPRAVDFCRRDAEYRKREYEAAAARREAQREATEREEAANRAAGKEPCPRCGKWVVFRKETERRQRKGSSDWVEDADYNGRRNETDDERDQRLRASAEEIWTWRICPECKQRFL